MNALVLSLLSHPARVALAAALLAAAAQPVAAQSQMESAPVQRCRIIPADAARLACYDAIALPGIGSRAGWGAPVRPTRAATASATAGQVAATPGNTFGLESRIAESAPDQMVSRLAGSIEGWEPNDRFTLENGQVWQVVDGSRAYYGKLDQPKVVISRGMLGSFYMNIDGVAQAPRVRRIQ